MILCVNANAAIDKTALVGSFRLGEIHRPNRLLALAGGKGNNVARALNTLGEKAVVTGWVGGYSGQFIEGELHREGIETAFVQREAESRTCLSIRDESNGTMTEVYERGEPVTANELAALVELFKTEVGKYEAVALSGSVPPGVPTDFYAQLIVIAHAASVPVYLDASGVALKEGLAAKPALIKPNKQEFADLVGDAAGDMVARANEAAVRYGVTIVLSLGADGALAATGTQVIQARPAPVEAVSAVGSGDCLLAGVISRLTKGEPLAQALRNGVAAGTANTLRLGAGVFTLEDFNKIYADVVVDSL